MLNQECGAFVTLQRSGRCCGAALATPRRIKPLYHDRARHGHAGRSARPALPPVAVSELSQLEYEISVLSPLRRVINIDRSRSAATAC